jgi:hypothetical protein
MFDELHVGCAQPRMVSDSPEKTVASLAAVEFAALTWVDQPPTAGRAERVRSIGGV